jgi:hypothetical protein
VAAAIELEEQALGRHPLAAAAVARQSTPAGAGQTGRPEDPLDARPADGNPLPFGEELGQVAVVDVVVRRPAELDDPGPERRVKPPPGWSSPVAVDEPDRAEQLAMTDSRSIETEWQEGVEAQ